MEQTGLLSLPEDVLIHIGHFLDLQSLLACSSSCQYLRRALNYNGLWKKHCSKDFNYINKADCLVTPTFQYDEDDMLDRLCDERVNLLRQKHLLSNWREGRYVSHEVQTSDYLHATAMLYYNPRKIVFKDVYIFLHKKFINEIMIWNVEAVPYIYTSVRFAHYGRDVDLQNGIWYEILEDKLLVIQGNLVQVFHIQLPAKELPLEYIIYVDSDVAVKDLADNLYSKSCQSWVVGNRIISRMWMFQVWNIHIWDILTGTKVRTSEVPYTCISLFLLCADDEDTFFLGLEVRRHLYHIFRYCVSKNQYTLAINDDPIMGRPSLTMRYNDGLLLFFPGPSNTGSIVKYDFNTSSLTQATFEELNCLNRFRIVGDKLMLATTQSIQVVDIISLQPIKIIKAKSTIFDFLPFFKIKVFVTYCSGGEVEFFDIDREIVFFKVPQERHYSLDHCSLNQSCSKLILLSSRALTVYHFW